MKVFEEKLMFCWFMDMSPLYAWAVAQIDIKHISEVIVFAIFFILWFS
jgi:hypothetical protein